MECQHDEPRVLTANEVAKRLRLNKRTVLKLADEGVIPGTRIGKCYRFDSRKIEALFDVTA